MLQTDCENWMGYVYQPVNLFVISAVELDTLGQFIAMSNFHRLEVTTSDTIRQFSMLHLQHSKLTLRTEGVKTNLEGAVEKENQRSKK